jgi:hypothetical protein
VDVTQAVEIYLGMSSILCLTCYLGNELSEQVRITDAFHKLTYPIPWCRILFEKLIVTHLVKKYPAFLCNPKVHYRVHTSAPLDPILSQLKPVHLIDPCFPKVHLNVILPTMPRSSQWSLAFGHPNQNPINTSTHTHDKLTHSTFLLFKFRVSSFRLKV